MIYAQRFACLRACFKGAMQKRHCWMVFCSAAAGIPKGKPEDQALAWKRTFEFFKQHLG